MISPQRQQRNRDVFGTEQPIALVTGSGSPRVGRTIARHLAESGYHAVLHADRSIEAAKETCTAWQSEGLSASMVSGSIEDEQAIELWINQIVQDYGGLHVVVNSAAIWEPTPLESLNAKALERQWRINLVGPTVLTRAAGLAMIKQSCGGAIINIGDAGINKPYCDFAAYLLSKSAIPAMTRIMARELSQRNPNVRVSAVMPGPVLLDDSIPTEKRELILRQTLLHRTGTPGDVAEAVQYLCEAKFVTGAILEVDGGRSFHDPGKDETLAHPTYQPRHV
ncbi:MAG: SDR family oxidoreductase [Pirellulales bacterium]